MLNVKNPKTDVYERDRSLRSEKLNRNEITIAETRKKNRNDKQKRKQVQIFVK